MSQITNSVYTIINIIITLFNGYLCMRMISLLFEIDDSKLKKCALYIVSILLSGMVIFIGDLANLPPTLIAFIFVIHKCTKGSFWKKNTISLILCCCAFSFNAICDSFFLGQINMFRPIYWIILFLFIKKIIPDKTFDLSSAYWKILMLLTITPLGIVLSLVLLQSPSTLDYACSNIANVVLLSLSSLSFVGLLYTVSILIKQQKLEEDHLLYEINQTYYKNMEQQQYEIRRLRHDMANHLQTLASIPTEELKDYLGSLNNDIAFDNTITFCKDNTINAVLNNKLNRIKDLSIQFDYHILITNELPITKTDICALFSNFMDNAIEACEKIESGEKIISLDAKTGKGLLVIHVVNTFVPVSNLDIDLKTTKKDALNHGYGLKSIREIVTRYHGNYEIDCSNNKFSLFLYVPI